MIFRRLNLGGGEAGRSSKVGLGVEEIRFMPDRKIVSSFFLKKFASLTTVTKDHRGVRLLGYRGWHGWLEL